MDNIESTDRRNPRFPSEHICSKEIYLKMRDMQKHIMEDKRKCRKAYRAWEQTRKWTDDGWVPELPTAAYADKAMMFFSYDARAFNIVYGIVKGRTYSQIEKKTKQDNTPDQAHMRRICEYYKLDFSRITEAVYA